MENPTLPLTVAQAARELGMSARTLRRRVADGKIPAIKGTTPETGSAWFIEPATVAALQSNSTQLREPAPEEEKEKEQDVAALVRVAPEQNAEVMQLRADVQQIKAFLLGQAMAEGAELPPNLGTVIGQAMRETLAPLVERIQEQSAENALLKQQLAEALTREQHQVNARKRRLWWPFSKRQR